MRAITEAAFRARVAALRGRREQALAHDDMEAAEAAHHRWAEHMSATTAGRADNGAPTRA